METMRFAERTDVVFGRGLPEEIVLPHPQRTRVVVVTHAGAAGYAGQAAESLSGGGLRVELVEVPDGDAGKTLEIAGTIYETLGRVGVNRYDTIVGVGGGAVTDLAGFVAGTWMRGVEVVHIPTTLLAAVDAAVGGKTAINQGGKNTVGVFWHPSRVVVDYDILDALPPYIKRDGLIEVLKAGLIGDPGLLTILATDGAGTAAEQVVPRALAVKAEVVAEDERDKGRRAVLNLGHTIGHAVEFASPLSHGEAVGVGLAAAAAISERLLGFPGADSVVRLVELVGAPTSVRGLDPHRVRELLELDKKRDGRGHRMALLREVGDVVVDSVGAETMESGLAAIGL